MPFFQTKCQMRAKMNCGWMQKFCFLLFYSNSMDPQIFSYQDIIVREKTQLIQKIEGVDKIHSFQIAAYETSFYGYRTQVVFSFRNNVPLRFFRTLEYSKPKRSLVAQLELLRSRWLRSSSMIMILKNMFVLLHQGSALVFLRVVSYFVIIELGHVPMSKQAFLFGPACRQHVGSPFEAMITGLSCKQQWLIIF